MEARADIVEDVADVGMQSDFSAASYAPGTEYGVTTSEGSTYVEYSLPADLPGITARAFSDGVESDLGHALWVVQALMLAMVGMAGHVTFVRSQDSLKVRVGDPSTTRPVLSFEFRQG